jgi:dolichyl-diphosphooligosaccharide--protein glycosyltransferase
VAKKQPKNVLSADPPLRPHKGDINSGVWWYYGTLLIVVLCALWLRLDDLIAWHHQPVRAFFNGNPILVNFDGYYYLSLARDLVTGNYGFTDTLRGIPHSPPSPALPPLISVMAATLARVTPYSLDWIASVVPALLGVMLAVPMVLFSRIFGGRLMAVTATASALFANYFVYRSHLGWFDTDCLNVTWLFFTTYFFIRFGQIDHYRRYFFLLGGVICSLFFLWWWDQTPAIVILLCFSQLAVIVALYYRPKGLERRIALAAGISVVVILAVWQGPQTLMAPFKGAVRQWGYISRQQTGDFPNVGISVFEQKRMDLGDLVQRTTGHPVAFGLGLLGFVVLFWRRKRTAATLAVPFGLGCLSFILARRFIIFLNPVLALGLGYIAQLVWDHRSRWPLGHYLAPALITVSLLLPFKTSWDQVYWPKEIPPIIEGLDTAGQISEENAVIWAWWDHGYPLGYFSRRATINDGSLHGGMRTVCNALPFATSKPQFASNFMYFYVTRGMSGMKDLFTAAGGAEKGIKLLRGVLSKTPAQATALIETAGLEPVSQWKDFFFPMPEREIYLFLDLRLARTAYWWSWFGTWDVGRRDGDHAMFKLFINCRKEGETIKGPELELDLTDGWATHRRRRIALSEVHLINDGIADIKTFPSQAGLFFIYNSSARVGALMEKSFLHNNFSQMYLLDQPDSRFFSLEAQRFPYYQLWRVRRPEHRTGE